MNETKKVMYDTKLSVLARLTMMYFLSLEEDIIEASIDELKELMNCSNKTMSKVLKELEENNYIGRNRRGLGKSNTYTILGGK